MEGKDVLCFFFFWGELVEFGFEVGILRWVFLVEFNGIEFEIFCLDEDFFGKSDGDMFFVLVFLFGEFCVRVFFVVWL